MGLEENLYILNQLVKIYAPTVWVGYIKYISNHDDARWYADYGAEVEDDDEDEFIITTTEEFVQNIQPLLDTPVTFENIILRWNHVNTHDKKLHPSLIRKRSYIKADIDSNTIILSATEKGSDLIIDDILFGSKGLMIDIYQNIDSYTIKSSDDDTLVLELDISDF